MDFLDTANIANSAYSIKEFFFALKPLMPSPAGFVTADVSDVQYVLKSFGEHQSFESNPADFVIAFLCNGGKVFDGSGSGFIGGLIGGEVDGNFFEITLNDAAPARVITWTHFFGRLLRWSTFDVGIE